MSDDIAARAEAAERERDELRAFRQAVYSLAGPRPPAGPGDEPEWRVDLFEVERQAILPSDHARAEAKLAKAVEALRPFAERAETLPSGSTGYDDFMISAEEKHFRCARATLAELTDTGGKA